MGILKDWWTKQDADQFVQHANCVVDQYAQYVVGTTSTSTRRLTEGEDVADLGGTILAYVAWKDATKSMHFTAPTGSRRISVSSSASRSGLRKQPARK